MNTPVRAHEWAASVTHCGTLTTRSRPSLLLGFQGLGPFVKGGVCASLAWMLVWPMEVAKSNRQAGLYKGMDHASTGQVLKHIVSERGISGLYSGIGPGLLRSLVANGSSMIVFTLCQELMRRND